MVDERDVIRFLLLGSGLGWDGMVRDDLHSGILASSPRSEKDLRYYMFHTRAKIDVSPRSALSYHDKSFTSIRANCSHH